MAIYYDYLGKLDIYRTCSQTAQNGGKWILPSTWHSFGVLCLVWSFNYKKETENWRDASREPLRQFGGAGALNIDKAKGTTCVCMLEKGKLKDDVIEVIQYLKGKVLRKNSQALFWDTQCNDKIQPSQVAPPREIPTRYKEKILQKWEYWSTSTVYGCGHPPLDVKKQYSHFNIFTHFKLELNRKKIKKFTIS